MHQTQRSTVRVAVVVLLCCLGHSAEAFLPSGGRRLLLPSLTHRRHMNNNLLRSSTAASAAASTPLPTTAVPAQGNDADTDVEPSAPAAHRRKTWVQPFVSNPVGGGTSSATSTARDRIESLPSRPGEAPAFLYRRSFHDFTTAATPGAVASPGSPAQSTAETHQPAPPAASSEPAASTSAATATPKTAAAAASRKTWVQPSHPPTPVSGTTAKRAADRAESSLPSRPGNAPMFLNQPAHYDMSASAATSSAAAVAATTVTASQKAATAAGAGEETRGAAAGEKQAPTAAAAEPASPPTAAEVATAVLESSSPSDVAAASPASPATAASATLSPGANPSPEAPPVAAKKKTTRPPASTAAADVVEPLPSSGAAATAATATAAASAPSPKAPPNPEPPVTSEKTAPPPPPPIDFEPAPTLMSDSPVYQDVALTIKRAKETLAPFRKKIQDNVAEGNVGERGEEWTVAQFAILLFVAMGSVPLIGGLVTLLAGPGLLAGGIGVCAAGVKGLGKSLSPWPAPIEENKLNTEGIYGVVRHPMYTGLVMCCLGFGVVTDSPLRMLLAVALALILDKKVEKEEKMLVGLHGSAYEEYRKMVAKFVPRFY